MICRKCGRTLIVDDEDYQFKGCYDQYLVCPNSKCLVYGYIKVRYNKCILEEQYEYSESSGERKTLFSVNPSKMDGSEFGGNNERK